MNVESGWGFTPLDKVGIMVLLADVSGSNPDIDRFLNLHFVIFVGVRE